MERRLKPLETEWEKLSRKIRKLSNDPSSAVREALREAEERVRHSPIESALDEMNPPRSDGIDGMMRRTAE